MIFEIFFFCLCVLQKFSPGLGPAEMLLQVKLRILLQGLTLFMLFSSSSATSLGLTVHVVPLGSSNGETVGHFFASGFGLAPTQYRSFFICLNFNHYDIIITYS